MGSLQTVDSPFSLLPFFHHIFPLLQCVLSTACSVYLLYHVGPCKGCQECLLLHRAPDAPPLALALVFLLVFLTLFLRLALPLGRIFPHRTSSNSGPQ